jgi:hypothetical protein
VIIMSVGNSTSGHVPSSVPGAGPSDARGQVGKHVNGSGDHPGTGAACSGPSAQDPGNNHRPLT